MNADTLANIQTAEDWNRQRETYREQLREMLGLSPLPKRTDLLATITGREEHPEFYVEKLHYQSLPGLYVGANLYVPKQRGGRVPAILYVCGHGRVFEDGESMGNKTHYQHHGAWFARNGYVCLTIDTIQLGELPGLHHGTFREGMWWWNSRGYTPAGVEAWNSIRGLDYLQSRPEVDGDRLGVTGRSGGGAYSWWTAALDDRIKAAVPVAGITDLRNHVVDGCVEGHCDCMFMVNTYRWDYAKVAALVAPRPLLIANSDKDRIFPLDGVVRVHAEVARIYRLLGAADKLGLLITEGPHRDTQELRVPAFRWFNRFLKGEESLIRSPAEKFFAPRQLKVFEILPVNERTTTIHETFVAASAPAIPTDADAWRRQKEAWLKILAEKSFAGWPEAPAPHRPIRTDRETRGNVTLSHWRFTSQDPVQLPLLVFAQGELRNAKQVRLHVLDEPGWQALVAELGAEWNLGSKSPEESAPNVGRATTYRDLLARVARGEAAVAFLPPRGIGATAWSGDEKAQVQVRRRFMLLGQTLEGMRVWDICRAIEAVRKPEVAGTGHSLELAGERHQAVNALYASLFTQGVSSLELIAPPASHQTGPDYLNVLRFLDVPQALTMAAERIPITLKQSDPDNWSWATTTASRLGWPSNRLAW